MIFLHCDFRISKLCMKEMMILQISWLISNAFWLRCWNKLKADIHKMLLKFVYQHSFIVLCNFWKRIHCIVYVCCLYCEHVSFKCVFFIVILLTKNVKRNITCNKYTLLNKRRRVILHIMQVYHIWFVFVCFQTCKQNKTNLQKYVSNKYCFYFLFPCD